MGIPQEQKPLARWQQIRQVQDVVDCAEQNWSWAQTPADEEYFWSRLQEAQARRDALLLESRRSGENIVRFPKKGDLTSNA